MSKEKPRKTRKDGSPKPPEITVEKEQSSRTNQASRVCSKESCKNGGAGGNGEESSTIDHECRWKTKAYENLQLKIKKFRENRKNRAGKVAGFQYFIPPIHQFLSAFSRVLYLKKTVPESKILPIVMEIAALKQKRTKIASCHPVRKKRVEQLTKKIEKLEKQRQAKA